MLSLAYSINVQQEAIDPLTVPVLSGRWGGTAEFRCSHGNRKEHSHPLASYLNSAQGIMVQKESDGHSGGPKPFPPLSHGHRETLS